MRNGGCAARARLVAQLTGIDQVRRDRRPFRDLDLPAVLHLFTRKDEEHNEKKYGRNQVAERYLEQGGLVHKWCGSRGLQQCLSAIRSLGEKIVIATITHDC